MPKLILNVNREAMVFSQGKILSDQAIGKFLETYLNYVSKFLGKSVESAHDYACLHLKYLEDNFLGEKPVWEYLVKEQAQKNNNVRALHEGRFKITIGTHHSLLCELPIKDTFAMFIIKQGQLLPICYQVFEQAVIFILKDPEDETASKKATEIVLTDCQDQFSYRFPVIKEKDNAVVFVDRHLRVRAFYREVSNDNLIAITRDECDQTTSGPVLNQLECSIFTE